MSSLPSRARLQALLLDASYGQAHVIDVARGDDKHTELLAALRGERTASSSWGTAGPLLGVLVVAEARVDALIGPQNPSVRSVARIIEKVTSAYRTARRAAPHCAPSNKIFKDNSSTENWPLVYFATLTSGGRGAPPSLVVTAKMYYSRKHDVHGRHAGEWQVLPLSAGPWRVPGDGDGEGAW